jgi:AraC family transcriptional regulator
VRNGAIMAGITYYDSAVEQSTHTHETDQISFLLLGSLHEQHRNREFEAAPGWIGVKPSGCHHANRFGRNGALLLTIEAAPGAIKRASRTGWTMRADASLPALARLALDAPQSALANDVVDDLLSMAERADAEPPLSIPKRLIAARAQLHEQPEHCRIDTIADDAGFERTHFARLFRAHFGVPPSVYRAQRMTAKATKVMLTEHRRIADAAFAAGFADHSHFTRTLRRLTGMSPSEVRAALG